MAKNRVVYSSDSGDQRKNPAGASAPRQSLPPARQDIRVRRETKGRKGKTVTVATGFALTEVDLNDLAKTLKSMCGAGGTTKTENDGQAIEIQGDHREKVAEKLQALGYKVKLAGG